MGSFGLDVICSMDTITAVPSSVPPRRRQRKWRWPAAAGMQQQQTQTYLFSSFFLLIPLILVVSSPGVVTSAWCYCTNTNAGLLLPTTATAFFRRQSGYGGRVGRTSSSLLSAAYSSDGSSRGKKNLRASEEARRDEEARRRERKGDVVIGKTSAKPDATDYSIDPRRTELEYLSRASKLERQVFELTTKGMDALKMLQLDEANQAFDQVFQIKPDAYLWQAGIAKYYLGDYEGASQVFARCATTYESKFGEPASEERTWRHACQLKLLSLMSKRERKELLLARQQGEGDDGCGIGVAQIPDKDNTAELLNSERRKVMRIARELFDASVLPEQNYSGLILARAKLRSIGGNVAVMMSSSRPVVDHKMWKLNSWYYLGLHYDATGELDESKQCMKNALRLRPSSGNGNDIIHTLPLLHMSTRDWFDDEQFDDDIDDDDTDDNTETERTAGGFIDNRNPAATEEGSATATASATADLLMMESIQSSVQKLRVVDLQNALKTRGMKSTGPKDELRQRFFESLLREAGLSSTTTINNIGGDGSSDSFQ